MPVNDAVSPSRSEIWAGRARPWDTYIWCIIILVGLAAILLLLPFFTSVFDGREILSASMATLVAAIVAVIGVQRLGQKNRETTADIEAVRYATNSYIYKNQIEEIGKTIEIIQINLTRNEFQSVEGAIFNDSVKLAKNPDIILENVKTLTPLAAGYAIKLHEQIRLLRPSKGEKYFSDDDTSDKRREAFLERTQVLIGECDRFYNSLVQTLDEDIAAGHHAASRLRLR